VEASRARLVIRRGTSADVRACHRLLWESATDLGRRRGSPLEGSEEDWWATGESLARFLAEHAAEWWVAESGDGDGIIGYARSIERGGLFELTELFVRPGAQSRGIGRELIERAFPVGRGEVRSIIATLDVRAAARYYAADTVARFPYFTLTGPPRSDADVAGDLEVEDVASDDPAALAAVTAIERAVLEFPRGSDELRWLAANRPGHLFLRTGKPVGFAFVAKGAAGPIAALDPADLPMILGHVEARAAELGADGLDLEVPGINVVAIRHLLGRGFRIDPWINLLMSNRPFGQLDRFIGYSPPIFL
jgi:GNAT superfamily N-acetyltransferase